MDSRWPFIGVGIALIIVAIWFYHTGAVLIGGGFKVEGNSPAYGRGLAYQVLAYLIGFFGVVIAAATAITFLRPARS